MARYTLVIGISKYDKFTHLPKAATDAEAIARVLEQHGDFYKVDRLPKRWVAEQNRYEVAPDKRVTADELFSAIEALLQEAEHNEVLIYFAGHGFRVASRAGKQRGFLAASDSTADGRSAIALDDDFNALLAQSNLSSLVMLLDCCHAGALLEAELTRQVIEPSLATFNAPRDFYLITACRAAERSREGETHGIFTAAVLEGLSSNNANQETGRISINRLFDFVYHSLQDSGQEPFQLGGGRLITLVTHSPQGTAVPEIDESIVPYRGLEPFEKEQAEFFFGRRQVVEDIWKALDRGNFVAVIGASGSGKSSVVRAGLIPWLEASGWHVLKPMKPSISPLAKLAATFEPLFQDNRSQKQLDEYIHSHPEGLRQLAEQLPGSANFLLVVDQFEEVFSLSRTEEQQRFINLLAQVAEEPHPRLAVVTTMRADFLEPCLQYSMLTQLIQAQAIFMPPLVGSDLEQAIAEPAKRLGYAFEPGLLGEILYDVGQEPGCLPLLQFALLELWERRDRRNRQLTCLKYEEMGGVLGAVDRQAEKTYQRLTSLEQGWARKICLKLVKPGKGMRDTRQQQSKKEVLALARNRLEDQRAIDITLQMLVDARLLVSGEEIGEAWIDLAHESLVESWKRFLKWAKENREYCRLIDRIEYAYREWVIKGKSDDYLLLGGFFVELREHWAAIEWALSSDAIIFYEKSKTSLQKQKEQTIKQIEEASLLKENFLTNTSDELRTPLNVIFGCIGLVKDGCCDSRKEELELLQQAEDSAKHLLNIINDLLNISKIEARQLELSLHPVSVQNLCRECLKMIQPAAEKKHLLLSIHVDEHLSQVVLDQLRVRQMLINLLSNAVKFTPEGGKVRLTSRISYGHQLEQDIRPDNSTTNANTLYLCLEVQDSGIGISKEHWHLLFRPFQQIASSLTHKHKYAGLGLGLAQTKRLAELHGGTLSFTSTIGKGSTFRIWLPFKEEVSVV